MTLMLASVTGPAEAELVLEAGADIIDLKDPSAGALGALPPEIVRESVARAAARRQTSAVTGDLPMEPDTVRAAAETMAACGVDYVKVGIFPSERAQEVVRALNETARRAKLIAVLFADLAPDFDLIDACADAGFAGAMLDTARKGGGRLLDRLDLHALGTFIARCHARGMIAGLAGSLEAPDVPRLLPLSPDLLGFRSALCRAGDRKSELDPQATAIIRGLIPAQVARHEASENVDWRLQAARGYSVGHATEVKTDRVFVRDLVQKAKIGAYSHEHGIEQRLRFNIEADVVRPDLKSGDMREVFSYDTIRDAIELTLARGHVALVETLAEDLAAQILRDARVLGVVIRIEKLDVVPGSVGVEIRRERPKASAKVHQLFAGLAEQGKPG
ncbi:MAG: dihydroneopterin aldolase [Methylobacteriaceae bacterium]|nr:dihydroneopterin aldolase [Methylobacteriaceae bacterium]